MSGFESTDTTFPPKPVPCSFLPVQISDIFNDYYHWVSYQVEPETYSKVWEISAWVRDFRSQSEHAFISLTDGSTSQILQVFCEKVNIPNFDTLDNLRGATVRVKGLVKKSPAKGQDIEMVCEIIEPIGLVADKNSIILAKTVQLETLRNYQHLRSRFRSFGYIYKIRSQLLKHIHEFFHSNGFYNLDPNIITTSDCEGAGEVFTITTHNVNEIAELVESNCHDRFVEKDEASLSIGSLTNSDLYKEDFFQKQAFLTVSSQLQLEALCAGLSRVYTLNPSFRAEKSKTKRHLGCFTHLEWEIAFIDINQLMDFSEALIKNVIGKTLKSCEFEYAELNKFISKGIIDKLNNVVNEKFERISYDKAIELVEEHKKAILKKFSKEITIKDIPKWGDDVGSYCERYIAEEIYCKPVFIYNYPKDLKSFYMKQNDDGKSVQAVDLLMPTLGELIGSSIREDSYEKLLQVMESKKMDKSVLEWYVDLRRNATFPHGGAGLGFDRLVNFCSLMDGNIRDVVPFPVAYQECDY
jgi:asparaginyl-tRNA synthetase